MELWVVVRLICAQFILRPIVNVLKFVWMLLDTVLIVLIIIVYYIALNIWAIMNIFYGFGIRGQRIRPEEYLHVEVRLIIRGDNIKMAVNVVAGREPLR